MIFKHRKATQLPTGDGIKEPTLFAYTQDLGRILMQALKNIYDDLINLEKTEIVTALPTAAKEYRGKIMVLVTTGLDEVYICLYNIGTAAYSWEQIL